jgi:succinyl-diaminopimelate desuccinylase
LNISDAIVRYESEIVRHIQELIRIRSVAEAPVTGKPFGEGVDRALQYMLELGEQLGFQSKNIDGYAGHIEYGSGEEMAGILVHLDTVPEGIGWTMDPFGGEIIDGRIYGRGATDDKGPAVVALFALKAFADLGITPKRRLRVIFGTNEENGMTDMDYYFAKEPVPDYGFSPDAGYPIIHAEKGYYVIKLRWTQVEQTGRDVESADFQLIELVGGVAPNVVPEKCQAIVEASGDTADRLLHAADEHERIVAERLADGRVGLTATGKSGHGSYPPSGINAIAHMTAFLVEQARATGAAVEPPIAFLAERLGFEAFGESLGIAFTDPIHGQLTVNLAETRVNSQGAEVILNVRIPVTTDGEAIITSLRERLLEDGIVLTVESHLPPLYVPAEHPLIQKLSRAYEMVTGEPTKLLSIGGGTYARKLQGNGVAFGAGFPGGLNTNVHQPDEFVVIADMMKHGRICTQAIYELIG